MSSEEQTAVETVNAETKIAEILTTEIQPTEITEPTASVEEIQQTTDAIVNNNDNDSDGSAPTSSKSKKKFVVGTEESGENNDSTSENANNSKEMVESHKDTKSLTYPTEEVVVEPQQPQQPQQSQQLQQSQQPQQSQQLQQLQKVDSDKEEYVNNNDNSNNANTKEVLVISTQSNSEPQLTQQPTPKEEKIHEPNLSDSSKPITMTPTEALQAAPVVTNTTVTAITQQQTISAPPVKQPAKFILRTPAESPDSTPISSPSDNIHNASCVNPSLFKLVSNISGQSPIQSNNILENYNTLPDETYSPETLNYPHQPRFPPSSNGISRTQQKLLLQRQHFLADDENYLIHPRNQLRLTKVIERMNREHAAILLYRDPIIESLQRVWPKYVQDHPEVLGDDFGVGYEDAKEWGVIPDHGKSVGHIGSNSIISTETLGIDSMPLRGIK